MNDNPHCSFHTLPPSLAKEDQFPLCPLPPRLAPNSLLFHSLVHVLNRLKAKQAIINSPEVSSFHPCPLSPTHQNTCETDFYLDNFGIRTASYIYPSTHPSSLFPYLSTVSRIRSKARSRIAPVFPSLYPYSGLQSQRLVAFQE